MKSMIEAVKIKHVSKKKQNRWILQDISLSIQPGEIVGLVGPNGAGKTSLMKLIAGYDLPTKGNIAIYGHDVIKDRVGAMEDSAFLVESPGLYHSISGLRHLEMFCDGRSIPRQSIHTVMDFLNFPSQLKDKVRTYSVGMKQRLALALCWLGGTGLIVLDEPVNGLDPEGILLLRSKIQEAADKGVSVLVSSHLLDELQKVSTRVVFIQKGKLIGDMSADDAGQLEQEYLRLFSVPGKEVPREE